MEYQERIRVGRGKFSSIYTLMENHFFIEFRAGVSDRQINQVLKRYKLELIEIPSPIRREMPPQEEEPAARAERRWVRAPEGLNTSAIARLKTVRRVAPVYIEEGRDLRSAAAPLPDVLLVEIPQEPSDKLMGILGDRYDMHDVPTMSIHLGAFSYFVIGKEGESDRTAYELLDQVRQLEEVTFAEYDWVIMQPDALIPSDTHWANQWDMARINTVDGWDTQTGAPGVIIAVLDSGCDLGHPDLTYTPVADHFNAAEAAAGDPPPYDAGPVRAHGTSVTGIAAADLNNGQGIAGVAGGCTVLPAYHGDSSSGAAASINWSVAHGANVINMSFGAPPIAALHTAVQNAETAGLVMVAATGNGNMNAIGFPAAYPEVIAVGASDQNDERKRFTSADGECWWGSNWGAALDVVAPGVLIWTTDRVGFAGYNQNGSALTLTSADAPCLGTSTLVYPTTGDAAGDYVAIFNGTSAASPHVAGLAALLISEYPTLTNHEVRDIIERTCEKVNSGMYAYAHQPGRTNGTWHQEMGYGRINVHRALRYCDLYIADHDLDDGTVPSSEYIGGTWTPRRFWLWQPFTRQDATGTHPSHYMPVDPNVDNWVYALVQNLGPATADSVTVSWHLMDYPGTALVYPADWNVANQIAQTTLASVAPGPPVVASALWPQASVAAQIVGMVHPCMVVQAICDQDVGGDMGTHVVEYNNIAQRNISYLPLDADAVPRDNPDAAALTLPFVIGNAASLDRYAELIFGLSELNRATAYLVDPVHLVHVPWVDKVLVEEQERQEASRGGTPLCFKAIFLDKTRLKLSICGCSGIATIQPGTSYRMDCGDQAPGRLKLDRLIMKEGASRITRSGREMIRLSANTARLGIPLDIGERIAAALVIVPPAVPNVGERYVVDIAQTDGFRLVGGLSFVVTAR